MMKTLCVLLALLTSVSQLAAQRAETLPLTASDLPFLLDVSGARQRVTFAEPVYARMWIDVTQGGVATTRTEVLLPEASDSITFQALLWRRDVMQSSRGMPDTNRVRISMETSLPGEPDSTCIWTNNDAVALPPLPSARPGAVSVALRCLRERPVDAESPVMSINETIEDGSGNAVDSRKIDVKIQFAKHPFRPMTR